MFFVLQLNRHTRKPMLISSTASSEVHTQQGTNSRSTSAPTAISTIPIVLAFEPFLTTVRRRLVQYPPISIASPTSRICPRAPFRARFSVVGSGKLCYNCREKQNHFNRG